MLTGKATSLLSCWENAEINTTYTCGTRREASSSQMFRARTIQEVQANVVLRHDDVQRPASGSLKVVIWSTTVVMFTMETGLVAAALDNKASGFLLHYESNKMG